MMVVVGRLEQVARVIDGKLAIRPMLPICFTFDHRVIDGVGCARVMNSIRSRLETPGECSSASVSQPARLYHHDALTEPAEAHYG